MKNVSKEGDWVEIVNGHLNVVFLRNSPLNFIFDKLF